MKHLYILLVCFLFAGSIQSQILFQKSYGGPRDDKGYSGFQTPDGGYIFCGNYSTATEHYFYLVKTDDMGDTLWTKRYLSDRDNCAYRIKPTTDTCYIIAGYSGAWQSNYTQDVFLLKVKANGDSIWGRTYGMPGTYSEEGFDVIQCKDGGYMMAGCYFATSSGYYYVVKTGSTGIQKWTRSYNVASSSSAKSVIQTLDGYYALSGPVFNSSYNHVGIAKIDSVNAPQKWFKNINVGGLEQLPTQVKQLPDSSYIILASVNVSGTNSDMCIVKTNSHGDSIFTKKFAKGRCQYIDTTSDGGYVVAGHTSLVNGSAKLVKLNSNFDTLWTKTYPPISGFLYSTIFEVHQTADKGFIMIGSTNGFSYFDALLIKTDSLGNIVLLVTGMTPAGPKSDVKIYPNPFSDQTKIILPNDGKRVHLKIMNTQGVEVKSYYASGKEITINRNELKQGSYTLLILDVDDGESIIAVKKIIID
jgi:hypothetical protein